MRADASLIFEEAFRRGLFTDAEVSVSRGGREVFHWAGFEVPGRDFFDLASLTKPLCTALLCVIAHERGVLDLNDPIESYLKSSSLAGTTLRELLNHVSPLKAWHDFAREAPNPSAFAANKRRTLRRILDDEALRSPRLPDPGEALYSDLGYMVLGAVLEKVYGADLAALFRRKIAKPLGIEKTLFFVPLARKGTIRRERFVPSETCAWRGRVIQGEVMDENAWVMGGVAGHAGLFGTAAAANRVLSELRRVRAGRSALLKKKTFAEFFVPQQARRLDQRAFAGGFDTPTKPGSQSGRFFSKNSIGHLGYSGTSFWWDLEKDVWIVLLSNRCVRGRANAGFAAWRPLAHDALMRQLKK